MTDFFVWRKEWLLNIEPIDKDHKEMVRLLNLLANHGEDARNIAPLDNFLHHFDTFINYVKQHFEREEDFMASINYPYLAKHKRDHTVQKAAFTAFRQHLVNSEMKNFEREDLNWIKMWFLDHVFGEDMEYANFYHDLQGKNS